MSEPDFDALRAERNSRHEAAMKRIADEMGWDGPITSSLNPDACYCACPAGPCEHGWTGPEYVSPDGCMSSATCARCGTTAISHDMRVMP